MAVGGTVAAQQRDDLLRKLRRYLPEADLSLVERAYAFAEKAHAGQFRLSGDPYIQHPLAVASILADLELDTITVAAALLHDVVEDTGVTLEEVERSFGAEVALLVDGVTKLGQLRYRTRVEEQAENLRKMLLAMARDIRVVLIKLADRLHNMRTLSALPEEKQRVIAQETLELFAPLAHRLGIFRFKWELEDLALRYLDPQAYRDLARRIPQKRREREAFAQVIIETLKVKLEEVGIRADIQGRAKHFYSIHQKMARHGRGLDDIYDLVAVRIIVDTVKDCYAALGVVHTLWKPLPGRFKDYIAMPKPNMYQSLHTTVVGPRGEPFEIQIRTWEMHRTAEYGIAAHWRYKEGGKGDADFDRKLAWLRELLEWQKDLRDAREFMESLKIDLFADEVFVFTPKGDVIDLPAGSTPIDFAYRIHTEVGHRCVGARVNGRITPLDTLLKNGDIVEILTNKQSPGPSADWLKIARTSNAKNKIRQWFRREHREENLAQGRELLARELRRLGLDLEVLNREGLAEELCRRLNHQNVEELLVSIGFGALTAAQVAGRVRDLWRRQEGAEGEPAGPAAPAPVPARPGPHRKRTGVRVKGADNVLVRFSRCCGPVPGDPIIGYVTRGKGIAIHRQDCANVAQRVGEEGRLVEVTWEETDPSELYPVEVEVTAVDRPGLLSDVTRVVADARTNILAAKTWTKKNELATIHLVLEVRDLEHLNALQQKLSRVRDVYGVGRIVHAAGK
ncbi:MAG: bifunctional (p)ppGpp synthetase/guanosine-3',5'-bis(diphosphate) 3'-pyrophosphohydrolase [Clostridia bacterium]|nr:bifunctional (p)ppGpp synthetase/guanosine-3',5'-bis(diphosphate) 3'-pyrophosphohydrolase [Clostridia bacterium]